MADDTQTWLEDLGLGKYGECFAENDIEIDLLGDLTDNDLKEIGVASLGHRKRLLREIDRLFRQTAGSAGPTQNDPVEQRPTVAERRQLTVMFCDLVGSTTLSQQLDPEDLRDVMRRYQDAVSAEVSRYGGHVAKFLGDGVLAYFGWPRAYEDQAERAVRAGLDAIAAVQGVDLDDVRHLDARVGIATGEVVVGDLVGEEGRDVEAVSGETPNLAARLQQIAAPGQVVVGATTHRLLRQRFDLVALGGHELKGFTGTTQAWSIAGESAAESRFEAARSTFDTPMVGRDHELTRLSECWRLACTGAGQAVMVGGEAGIGKSRLLEAIGDDVQGQSHFRIRYQCSPYHTTSPFYPIVQQMQRAAGITMGDNDDTKLDKMERLISDTHENAKETWAIFANLLSLPYQSRYGELDMSPGRLKLATLRVLFAELQSLARARPVLFIFEDAHWIDPTSLEFLSGLITEIQQSRVLFIVTYRPEWQPPEQHQDHQTLLSLSRLGREDNAAIAQAIAGGKVSADIIDRIVSRTDGIPLFVEELTKTLIESDFKLTEREIPATLQASLLARLDRLGQEVKEIAQIGAVIGRDFAYDLLTEVAGRNKAELDALLDKLVRSGLVFRKGRRSKIYFTFKHALIQDAAYSSLLRSQRQQYHAEIGKTLETRFAAQVDSEPELLARHFAIAGLAQDAIAYWRRAAAAAVSRSANQEALKHFTEALDLLSQLPMTEERDRLELDMRVAQGVPAIAASGYASPMVEEIYLRARDLSGKLGDRQMMFPIMRGLWNLYVDRVKFDTALEYAQALVEQAEEESDLERVALAHRALGFTCIQLARIEDAHTAFKFGIAAMEQHGRPADLQQYGEDGGLANQQYLAWTTLFRGDPASANVLTHDALTAADALDHAVSRAFARGIGVMVFSMCQDADQVLRLTEEMLDITTSHGLVFWQAHAMRYRGWALGYTGHIPEGLELLQQAETLWVETDALILRTVHQCLTAELHGLAGELEAGLAAAREGLRLVELYDERWYQAELLRIEGWLLQLGGNCDDAGRSFEHAIEVARQQNNYWWLLRAARSQAALLMEIGNRQAAHDLLAPVYNRFTADLDLRDLMAAKALLDELGAGRN